MATPPESGAGAGKATEQKKVAPTSHGRGGAGNINRSTTPSVDPASLETPTLKSSVYTTGRGGSGNMAKNTDPEEARRAQDVTGHPRRTSSNGQQHIGRGGAANVFKPSKEELEAAKKDEGKWESAIADDHKDGTAGSGKEKDGRSASGVKGLAEKGKEFLFGKK